MPRVCHVCGKGRISGNKVSHAMNHTRRTWKPNLRRIKANINGSPRRVMVCARCLKSNKIERAV